MLPELVLEIGPALERNRGRVELAVVVDDDTLALLSYDLARGSPAATLALKRSEASERTHHEKSSICQKLIREIGRAHV